MVDKRCSLCRGVGLVVTNGGLWSNCPVCKDRLKEFQSMSKQIVDAIDKEAANEKTIVLNKGDRQDDPIKKINKKPLRKKENGKHKEET